MKSGRILAAALVFVALLAWSSARAVNVIIDYTYDTSNFFAAGTQARATLEHAASELSLMLGNSFSAIQTPPPYNAQFGGRATWEWEARFTHPSTGSPLSLPDLFIPQDEYRIYAGARPLGGATLGLGGPGGWEAGWEASGAFFPHEWEEVEAITDAFFDSLETRGQGFKFARWGGTVAFNSSLSNWHFDHETAPSAGQHDFLSIALHELVHALGFTSGVFSDQGLLSDGQFIGSAAVAAHGGPVPMAGDLSHWAEGTMSTILGTATAQETLMDPTLTQGTRKLLTTLDVAALDDIGWQIVSQPISIWTVPTGGNWSALDNWTGGVPDAAGATAVFGAAITADRTITVNTPVTVGSIHFDNAIHRYTLAGPGTITIDSPAGQINALAGSHTISATVNLQVDTAIHVGQPADTLTVSSLTAAGVSLTKSGEGTLEINAVSANGLAVDDGTVKVLPGAGASTFTSLSVPSGAAFNLTDNSMTVLGGELNAISALVASGYADGTWTGSGINSSTAATESGRALGVGPDGGDIIVKFTWAGDATLDGAVNISDLSILAGNWQQSNRHWRQGDFNYDGVVNISDLSILAGNWQKGAAGNLMSFDEAMAMFDALNGVVVPEPASLALLCMASLLLLKRRSPRDRFAVGRRPALLIEATC